MTPTFFCVFLAFLLPLHYQMVVGFGEFLQHAQEQVGAFN
jgi:hypothetical protein